MVIKYEEKNGVFFYYTTVFNTKVNLSKALVEDLKEKCIFSEILNLNDYVRARDLILTNQVVTKNGKTYVNLYLTLKKDQAQAQTTASALPF